MESEFLNSKGNKSNEMKSKLIPIPDNFLELLKIAFSSGRFRSIDIDLNNLRFKMNE